MRPLVLLGAGNKKVTEIVTKVKELTIQKEGEEGQRRASKAQEFGRGSLGALRAAKLAWSMSMSPNPEYPTQRKPSDPEKKASTEWWVWPVGRWSDRRWLVISGGRW